MQSQQPYIVCPRCGMVSHNPNDVEQRYCGNCHAFHDDMLRDKEGRH
jgi:ribosomal protein S27AE